MAIASMIMMFAAFTSAYLVKKGDPNGGWENFRLPDVFWISTVAIVLSSITAHLAVRTLKNNNKNAHKLFLILTVALGFAFIYLQYLGWKNLVQIGMYVSGNPSGSFLYVITGAHILHVLGGIVFLVIALTDTFLNYRGPIGTLKFETNPGKLLRMELIATYWHFVDILWVYLFMFFLLNHL